MGGGGGSQQNTFQVKTERHYPEDFTDFVQYIIINKMAGLRSTHDSEPTKTKITYKILQINL